MKQLTSLTAPEPKPKKNRELKTDILPVEVAHRSGVLTPPSSLAQSPSPTAADAAAKAPVSLAAAVEQLTIDDGKMGRVDAMDGGNGAKTNGQQEARTKGSDSARAINGGNK